MNPTANEPTILDEVRRVKRELFDACGRDVHRMFEQLRANQQNSGHVVLPRVGPPRMPKPERA